MINFKKAFTLAEVISVVVILGVVAMITVPTTMKRTTERANKTKIIKAMAAYEHMIQQIAINEGINSIADLKSWATSITSVEHPAVNDQGDDIIQTNITYDCSNIIKYLNTSSNKQTIEEYEDKIYSERYSDNCTAIQTSDGLWWNFSDISKPIVAFKEENLTATKAKDMNSNEAFYFIVSWPEYSRTPMVNLTEDMNSDITEFLYKSSSELSNIMIVKKLYDYIGSDFKIDSSDHFCVTQNCCKTTSGSCVEIYQDPNWGWDYTRPDATFTNVILKNKNGEVTGFSTYIKNSNDKIEVTGINNNVITSKVTKDGVETCHQYTIKENNCYPQPKGYSTIAHSSYESKKDTSNHDMLLGCKGYDNYGYTRVSHKKIDCQ